MFSRCSHCQVLQTISVEQLRDSRGLLACDACGKHFDALATLTEHQDEELPNRSTGDFLSGAAHGKTYPKKTWIAGSFLGTTLLFTQLFLFNGQLLQQPGIRSTLETLCRHLNCRLPYYKNLAEWSLSHSEFHAVAGNKYVLTAAITNQAAYTQACPDIKLVMLNFNGQAIAERIFTAQQYTTVASLPANETLQIKLAVMPPPEASAYGGYTLNLL